MRGDLSSSFDSPRFKELLAKYEEMIRQQIHIYFESEELISIAEYYASQNKAKESEDAVNYALRLHPGNLEVVLCKCHALAARRDFEGIKNIIRSIPDQNDREVMFLRAGILLQEEKTDEAEKLLQQIANDDLCDLDTILDIADMYMDADKKDYAYLWLTRAYEKNPTDTQVLESLADYHFNYGEMDQAISIYNRLLDEDPYNIGYWIDITKCYLKQDNIPLAFDAIDFALAIDSHDTEALEWKGYCYIKQEQLKEAYELFMQTREKDSYNTELWKELIDLLTVESEYEKALALLDKIINSGQLVQFEMAVYYHKRAICYLLMEEEEKCQEAIFDDLACDNQYAPLFLVQSELYLLQKKDQKAKEEAAYAEAYAFDKAEMLKRIALGYLQSGHFQEALGAYHRLEKDYPDKIAQCYCLMAFCYYAEQNAEATTEYLIKTILYTPQILEDPYFAPEDEFSQNFFNMGIEIKKMLEEEGKMNPKSDTQ